MELRTLKYFLAVAQEENITKAAEILHTTQPNLSRQLNSLEEEFGRKLFIRGKRKITLTEEGMFLRKRAQEIIDLSNKTESELSLFGESEVGDIYIGAVETNAMRFIGETVVKIQQANPNIKFHFHSESTLEITEYLDKGLFDFGIVVEPIDLKKYDYIKLPIKDTWGILMHKDSPLAKLDSITPKDIKDKPILFAEQQSGTNLLSGWLGESMKNLNTIGSFNLITTPAMLIEKGLGYVFTFDKLVNTSNTDLVFKPLNPLFETSLFLIWKKYQILTNPSKMFLEELKNSISKIENSSE